MRFQVLFHSLIGVLFTFPHGTCSLSVTKEYLGLEVVPYIRARFHVSRFTQEFIYITFTGLSPSLVSISILFKFSQINYRPDPFSLATTNGISIDFFSSGYLDVSVLQLSLQTYEFSLKLHIKCRVSIRIFSDQNLHTAPRNLSQYTTSFVVF